MGMSMLMQAYNTCMYVSVPQENQKDPVSLEAPHTVEPRLMTTQILWPLFWPRGTRSQSLSHSKNPFNTTTPLIQPIFHCLKVVALKGSHCNLTYLAGLGLLHKLRTTKVGWALGNDYESAEWSMC